jgi:hypothetical protein
MRREEAAQERVFRFRNEVGLAEIGISDRGVRLRYVPDDDRLRVRELPCDSLEDALRNIFLTDADAHGFTVEMFYTRDLLEES